MKVLITGNLGFVGKATSKELHDMGHTVYGYDLMDGFDIADKDQVSDMFFSIAPDRVLHLAAIARFADADRDPMRALMTNVHGTRNVVDACREMHTPLIYSSTGSVYMPIEQEPPITEQFPARGNSVYACTKYLGELLVETVNPHIILRYAHLYGKDKRMHGLIGGYMDRINRGLRPNLYGGAQSNDFCYIRDVVQANVKALTANWDAWNQVYNIGTGEEISAKDAGEVLCRELGWYGGVVQHKGRTVDPGRFVYDISKARTMLGYEPAYSFKDGIIDMLEEMGRI